MTVLSAVDPVRLFQEFATLDLISKGRAELVVGRGSFGEAFPLFGLDPRAYDDLFAEKLDLFLRLGDTSHPRWQGRFRPELSGQGVFPRPHQPRLPVWIGVGGTEDDPQNLWSIVLLTDKPDPRYLAPFEARVDEGLPGFVEIYIRKDLGVELTKL